MQMHFFARFQYRLMIACTLSICSFSTCLPVYECNMSAKCTMQHIQLYLWCIAIYCNWRQCSETWRTMRRKSFASSYPEIWISVAYPAGGWSRPTSRWCGRQPEGSSTLLRCPVFRLSVSMAIEIWTALVGVLQIAYSGTFVKFSNFLERLFFLGSWYGISFTFIHNWVMICKEARLKPATQTAIRYARCSHPAEGGLWIPGLSLHQRAHVSERPGPVPVFKRRKTYIHGTREVLANMTNYFKSILQ